MVLWMQKQLQANLARGECKFADHLLIYFCGDFNLCTRTRGCVHIEQFSVLQSVRRANFCGGSRISEHHFMYESEIVSAVCKL
jgi:hypothetical protein